MPLTRLFAVALLLCPVFAVAQTDFGAAVNGPIHADRPFIFPVPVVEPVDLWNPIPQQTGAAQRLQDGINQYKPEPSQFLTPAGNLDKGILIPLMGDGSADGVCLTMRTYVVARDSKDSDSVHLTHYSTCQMAGKYRLKTTKSPDVIRPTPQP